MRVLHLCTTTLDTRYFRSMARLLRERGVEVYGASLTESAVPSWAQRANEYAFLGGTTRARYPLAVARLASFLRRERIDVLHAHLWEASLVGMVAARIARTPVVLAMRHHLDDQRLAGSLLHVQIDKWTARLADYVVVPSNAVREYMRTTEGLRDVDIEVVHHGFDFGEFRASEEDAAKVRAELGLKDDFVIGFVGRLVPNKGIRFLLEAAKSVLPRIPSLKVVIVGGGERATFEELSLELGLRDRVVFTGQRGDVAACMRAFDVLVHPTLSEAFGQVLVEAMSVGTPVIATRIGGISEIIDEGRGGILIEPRDADALAAAILDLHERPSRRRALGVEGSARARSHFSATRMVDEQLASYRRHLPISSGGNHPRRA